MSIFFSEFILRTGYKIGYKISQVFKFTQLAQVGPGIGTNTGYVAGPSVDAASTQTDIIGILIKLAIFLTGTAIIFGLIALALWLYAKRTKRLVKDTTMKDYVMFAIKVPRGNETQIASMEQVFASIHGLYKKKSFIDRFLSVDEPISFEIIGYKNYIGFFVYTPKKYSEFIENQIMGAYQSAEVELVKEPVIFTKDAHVQMGYITTTDKKNMFPIKTYPEWQDKSDPFGTIVGAFANMQEGEGAVLQILVVPAGDSWAKKIVKHMTKEEKKKYDKSVPKEGKSGPKVELTDTQMEQVKRKTSKVGFYTHIRVVSSAKTEASAKSRFMSIVNAFSQFTNPGYNGFKVIKVSEDKEKQKEFANDFVFRRVSLDVEPMVLNTEELATIYHFPNKSITLPGIDWLVAKTAPPPHNLPKKGVLWLGTSVYRGVRRPIYFASNSDRQRHTYIIGQTGTGKSWTLANMIMQDIYSGNGLAVLDPHGSLIEMVMERIPPERAEDIIYFNAGDTENPIGWNLLEHKNEYEKHDIVNSFLALMKKMFDPHDQGIVGPRFERAVRMAMLTVMSDPNSTLIEVLKAIADEDYARSFLPQITDPQIKLYYEAELAKTDKFHKSEILGWIVSKFDRFTTNILIRNIIGQSKSTFDVRKVMDEGKILLVNLSQGLIGVENAQFLGLLIVPKILRAALSREDMPEDQRRDFYLYVDEFQNFATDDFAKILSEARKYRLNLIVANQYISQMTDKIRDAVFGNVGNLFSFRVGPTDAEYLEKQFAPIFDKEDLTNIPNINCYVKMLVNGVVTSPFSMNTYFDADSRYPKHPKVAELVKKLSRLKYGKPVSIVNDEIEKRMRKYNAKPKRDTSPIGAPPLSF